MSYGAFSMSASEAELRRSLKDATDLAEKYRLERDSNAALAFEWAKKQGLAVAEKINAEKREAKLRADLHNLHRYCKGAPVIQEIIEAALSASRKESGGTGEYPEMDTLPP